MNRNLRGMAAWLFCGGLVVALAAIPGVRAAETDSDEEMTPTQAAAAKVEMAARLEEFGKSHRDPSALISAGILLLQAPKPKAISTEPTATGPGAAGAKTESLPDFKAQAQELFDAAVKMADESKAKQVKEMIALAMNNLPVAAKKDGSGTRGLADGPKTIRRMLPKDVVDTYEFEFNPKEAAHISVKGEKKLHIEVIRPTGEHVCDVNFTSAAVNFTPINKKKWTVKISNISKGPNSYTLTVN